MNSDSRCPQCGAALPAPGAPCSRCLLAAGLECAEAEPGLGRAAPELGTTVRYVGDYELLERIATGGMGVLYKARQRSLNRVVALKMLLGGAHAAEEFRARFRREAETLAQLHHPNIVPIHEVGEHEGLLYFSMEYVAGTDLGRLTRDQPLGALRAARYVRVVAEAVQYAHDRGVLHRDLKPSNILLGEDDRPRVSDFGLARGLEGGAELTRTGETMGTPGYLPPEQVSVKRGRMGPLSDVYSLGAVLYCLLTGRAPFLAGTIADTLDQVCREEPAAPRLLNASVPRDLETICLKCLEKDPGHRYASARALAQDLERFERREPIAARPAGPGERLLKWYRRQPVVAGLVTGIAAALLLGFITTYTQWRGVVAANAKLREATLLQRFQLAEGEYKAGRPHAQLEGLAVVLREQPTNRLAALRLTSALAGRNYLLPRCPPLAHGSPVQDLGFDAGGSLLMTADYTTVWLWDRGTGVRVGAPLTHQRQVYSTRLSPDARWVVTLEFDGPAQLWNARTGEWVGLLGPETVSRSRPQSPVRDLPQTAEDWLQFLGAAAKTNVTPPLLSPVAVEKLVEAEQAFFSGTSINPVDPHLVATDAGFSVAGDRLAVGFATGLIAVYRTDPDFTRVARIAAPVPVSLLAFVDGDRMLVGVAQDGSVHRWTADRGESMGEPFSLGQSIAALEISEEAAELRAVESDDIVVWQLTTGRLVSRTNTACASVAGAAFSPDGQRVALYDGGRPGKVWIQEAGSGRTLAGPLLDPDGVTALCFSPDGLVLATAGGDFGIRLRDGFNGAALAETAFQASPVTQLQFSADGRTLGVGTEALLALLFDLDFWHPLSDVLPSRWGNGSSKFDATGQRLLTAGADRVARCWDWRTGSILHSLTNRDALAAVDPVPDGHSAVLTTVTGRVRWWDMAEGTVPGEFEAGTIPSRWPIRIHPDGTELLALGNSGLQVRRVAPGLPLVWSVGTNTAGGHAVFSAEYSRDGRRIVTAGQNSHACKLWDSTTGALLRTFERRQHIPANLTQALGETMGLSPEDIAAAHASLSSLAAWALQNTPGFFWAGVSPDGRVIATAPFDGTADVWSDSGTFLRPLVGHTQPILHGCFSPDGTKLATASEDGTVRLWGIPAGDALGVIRAHERKCVAVRFSADGRRLVTCGFDQTARIWDVHTLEPLSDVLQHWGDVRDAAFSPDGQVVVTTAKEGHIRIWELPEPGGSVPNVLLDFVERLAGVGAVRGFAANESASDLYRATTNLMAISRQGPLGRWCRWRLDSTETNTVSFFSRVTRADYIRHLTGSTDVRDLRRAVLLNPTNALALGRLGVATAKDTNQFGRSEVALFYLRRAVRYGLSPTEAATVRDELARAGVRAPAPLP